MSAIYNTEPQPTGSVILHTNLGELSVELFAKQTPLTCRNFLQLCLDGYYDNTAFHRIIPGFIIQGGDPTGTGNGGESIYDGGVFGGDLDPWPMDQRRGKNSGMMGVNFKDEFHSRLKFNRRGLLGMANDGTVDSNGSQFFFTLGVTEELTGKNTMFGRIAGDTIYNLAKMGEAEIEEGSERPLYPIKVTTTEILVNPFDDMKKRTRVAARQEAPIVAIKKDKKKRRGGKQLLSFGEDEGDVELPQFKKAKFDTRIVMEDEEDSEMPQAPRTKVKGRGSKQTRPDGPPPTQPMKVSTRPTSAAERPLSFEAAGERSLSDEDSSPKSEEPLRKTKLERTNEEIAALKASLRRPGVTAPVEERKKSTLEEMIPQTSTRGRKRRPGGNNPSAREEKQTLDMLKAFQSRLEAGPSSKEMPVLPTGTRDDEDGDIDGADEVCDLHFIANCQSCQSWDKLEAKEDSDDEGWLSHTLNFAADKLGKDLSYRRKAEDELIVIDPREKARTLKEEKRAERDARSGGSGRAWDQMRNAQMARSSALAGRGAK
jgi:peptidyl-prolyl cis-trans isomerase SDCCAG10